LSIVKLLTVVNGELLFHYRARMKIFGRDFESEPIARWSLAVVFGWLGVMRVLEGGDALGSVLPVGT